MEGKRGGGRDRKRDGESKEIGGEDNRSRPLVNTAPSLRSTYAHKRWICLLDALYALLALVLSGVRGLDVKVRFAL